MLAGLRLIEVLEIPFSLRYPVDQLVEVHDGLIVVGIEPPIPDIVFAQAQHQRISLSPERYAQVAVAQQQALKRFRRGAAEDKIMVRRDRVRAGRHTSTATTQHQRAQHRRTGDVKKLTAIPPRPFFRLTRCLPGTESKIKRR